MVVRFAQKELTVKLDWATMFLSQIVDYGTKAFERTKAFDISQFKNPFKNLNFEKFKKITAIVRSRIFLASLVLIILAAGVFAFKGRINPQAPKILSQTNFAPQQQVAVGKTVEIPIRNSSGAAIAEKLTINFTTVDKSNRILIQGKPATARDGKTFIILNLEIDNSTKNQLTVRPVEFIRLQDQSGKSFAPDVHNDAVKVEPVSVKRTRVGFVTDINQKNFKFLIGEITGDKQTVEVSI